MKTQPKKWSIKPVNDKAKKYCNDFFYKFGKNIHYGASIHWNGNDFLVSSEYTEEEWEIKSPEGVVYTLETFKNEVLNDSLNLNREYEHEWGGERDKPIFILYAPEFRVSFWMVDVTNTRFMTNEADRNNYMFQFRICSSSATRIEAKFNPWYRAEVNQWYELDKKSPLIPKDKIPKWALAPYSFWMVGIDQILVQSTDLNGRGRKYSAINIGGKPMSNNWYYSSFRDSIEACSKNRYGDCRADIKKFDEARNVSLELNMAIDNFAKTVKKIGNVLGKGEKLNQIIKELEALK